MEKNIVALVEMDEDGVYISTVPSIRGCHTQANTVEELMKRTKEIVELMLEHDEDPQGKTRILYHCDDLRICIPEKDTIELEMRPEYIEKIMRISKDKKLNIMDLKGKFPKLTLDGLRDEDDRY